MANTPDSEPYWEGSELYKAQERKRQREIYAIWREQTIDIAQRIAEGDPDIIEIYEKYFDREGMNGETLDYAIQLFREGKTIEEVGTGLDDFMEQNSPRYREENDRQLREAIDEDIANGMPHAGKMLRAIRDHDEKHEHDN